jgi:DNA-binding winged helix-turn-helix (wHTH) protein
MPETPDLEKRPIDFREERAHLGPKEFAVLRLLLIQQSKPVNHKKISIGSVRKSKRIRHTRATF